MAIECIITGNSDFLVASVAQRINTLRLRLEYGADNNWTPVVRHCN